MSLYLCLGITGGSSRKLTSCVCLPAGAASDGSPTSASSTPRTRRRASCSSIRRWVAIRAVRAACASRSGGSRTSWRNSVRIYSNTDLLATTVCRPGHPLLMVCLQPTDAPEEWFFNETEKKLCEQHASEANPHARACQLSSMALSEVVRGQITSSTPRRRRRARRSSSRPRPRFCSTFRAARRRL